MIEKQIVAIASNWFKCSYGFMPAIRSTTKHVLNEKQQRQAKSVGQAVWMVVFCPVVDERHPEIGDPRCLIVDDYDGSILG